MLNGSTSCHNTVNKHVRWRATTDAPRALKAYLHLLRRAQRSISISTWIVYQNSVLDQIAHILHKKLRRGVKVTLAYYGGLVPELGGLCENVAHINITGGSPFNLDQLQRAGAQLIACGTRKSHFFGTHEKLTCVDQRWVNLSDRNLADDYYGRGATFTGVDLQFDNGKLAQLVDAHIRATLHFDCDSGGCGSLLTTTLLSASDPLQFFVKDPRTGRDNITHEYSSLLRRSRKILLVNAVFNPSAEIVAALKYAATENRAEIVIVTNYHDGGVGLPTALGITRTLAHHAVRNVPNLTLYGYDGYNHQGQRKTLHNKFVCTDQGVLFGSFNFDFYSAHWDKEYVVRINGDLGQKVAGELRRYAYNELLKDCRPIESSNLKDWCYSHAFQLLPCLL